MRKEHNAAAMTAHSIHRSHVERCPPLTDCQSMWDRREKQPGHKAVVTPSVHERRMNDRLWFVSDGRREQRHSSYRARMLMCYPSHSWQRTLILMATSPHLWVWTSNHISPVYQAHLAKAGALWYNSPAINQQHKSFNVQFCVENVLGETLKQLFGPLGGCSVGQKCGLESHSCLQFTLFQSFYRTVHEFVIALHLLKGA